mmetsp:Transcript_35513/g.56844  ORF Transcript_35513/g.56844 Transcript_35513/m.56844 type:complete len:1108 (+) Transcript_35513:2139-5462(+)
MSGRAGGRRGSSYGSPATDSNQGQQAVNARHSLKLRLSSTTASTSDMYSQVGAKNSAELRRKRLRIYLGTSKIGYFLDLLNGLFSVLSCALVVMEMYNTNEWLDSSDLLICFFFLFDYLLRLYLADSRCTQVLSSQAIVDLLTILPTFIELYFDIGSIDDYKVDDTLFIVKEITLYYIRILRLLRLRRLLTYAKSEQKKEIGLVVLNLITALVLVAAILFSVENHFRQWYREPTLEFHEIMYFLVVTLSTVGYGDISMITMPGKIMVTLIICLALFYIPKSTNKILKHIGNKSIYSTMSYTPTDQVCHVIVTGSINAISARDFLHEIFHADHGNSSSHVVFLMQGMPTKDLEALLEGPEFSNVVTYLEGSPLVKKDLQRACIARASTCFILANKFSTNPHKLDAVSILKALSIKRHVMHTVGHDMLVCIQFIRPESKNLFTISRSSIPCQVVDQVISIEQVKMDIMAKSCLCPGFNTMISNLVGSAEEEVDAEHLGTAPRSEGRHSVTKVIPEASVNSSYTGSKHEANNDWYSEYASGATYEIYRTRLHPVFTDVPFCSAVEVVYQKLGVLMFAIDIKCPTNMCQRVVLNPGMLQIPATKQHNVHAFVIAKDEADAELSFSNKTLASTTNELMRCLQGLQHKHTLPPVLPTPKGKPVNPFSALGSKQEASGAGKTLKGYLNKMKKSEQKEEYETDDRTNFHISRHHARLVEVTIHTSLREELPSVFQHIVVAGSLQNSVCFVRTLRARGLREMIPIVLLSLEPPASAVWQKLAMFPLVFYVQGSPFQEADLKRAGIEFAASAVVVASNAGEESSDDWILKDANAILARQAILRLNPNIKLITEIVNSANLYLLNELDFQNHTHEDSLEPNPEENRVSSVVSSGYSSHHVPSEPSNPLRNKRTQQDSLASGSIFSTSMLDVLICQSFYNPHLLAILQILISGTNSRLMNSLKQDIVETIGDFNESNLYQVEIPHRYVGKTYGELLTFLTKKRFTVPLGLYRDGGVEGMNSTGSHGNTLPYVFTNPPPSSIVFENDLVFVLSLDPPSVEVKDRTEQILAELKAKVSSNPETLKVTNPRVLEVHLSRELARVQTELCNLKQLASRVRTLD